MTINYFFCIIAQEGFDISNIVHFSQIIYYINMEIKKLLEVSKINWPDGVESLESEFDSIIELVSCLPEPENLDASILERYATLAQDEEDKKAEKTDIITSDMFVI